MGSTYHLLLNGRQTGPFTLNELQRLLATGEIHRNHLVWRPGLEGWTPVGLVMPPPLPMTGEVGSPAPPPLPMSGGGPHRSRRGSKIWLWVGAGVGVVVAAVVGLVIFGVREFRSIGTDRVAYRPLFEDRAGHSPKWRDSSFEAAGSPDEPKGGGLTLIRYHSPAGELAAYLSEDPKDGRRHPAMVWAHGGFGGIGSVFWDPSGKRNDQSARAFRERGIVLMCPSWRGENDNPGRFELFYGEVEDLLAAVEHVKQLPYVDPDRVYIGGHSTGGTLALLAAGASESFRAAFSFGGLLDGVSTLEGDGYGNTPYDPASVRDHRLRSPMRYAAFLRRPVFYFEGGDDYEPSGARAMKARAPGTFHPFKLPGDHFDILHPTTALVAEKILADTGPVVALHFTEAELRQRYEAAFARTLAIQLEEWIKAGGQLEKALENADSDDLVPRSPKDVDAVAAAVRHLESQEPAPSTLYADLARLAGLREGIEEEGLFKVFDARVTEKLVSWMRRRLAQPAPVDEEEADSLLALLASLAETRQQTAADLVTDAVKAGLAPTSRGWNAVFRSFDEEHPQTARVLGALADNPPGGFTGVLLLDSANSLTLDDWKGPHPFNSAKGAAQLRQWLVDNDPERSSFAHSAALGSAFLNEAHRGDLIALALAHPDRHVRLEGAWSDLKTGGTEGLVRLREACLDVHRSDLARDYLAELGHQNDIPAEAKEPAFTAQATMSRWLQHPNELNGDPLSLEVIDHRTLHWPPTGDQRELWLIKFTYQFPNQPGPKTAYGCVGSMTWSSLEEHAEPPSAESLYLYHCTLEMEREDGTTEKSATGPGPRQRALEALQKANPGVFDGLPPAVENNTGE